MFIHVPFTTSTVYGITQLNINFSQITTINALKLDHLSDMV